MVLPSFMEKKALSFWSRNLNFIRCTNHVSSYFQEQYLQLGTENIPVILSQSFGKKSVLAMRWYIAVLMAKHFHKEFGFIYNGAFRLYHNHLTDSFTRVLSSTGTKIKMAKR